MAVGTIDFSRSYATGGLNQKPTTFNSVPADFKAVLAEKSPALLEVAAKAKTESTPATPSSAVEWPSTLPLLETDQGPLEIDIDAYFDPQTAPTYKAVHGATLPPLLLPSGANLKALSDHASSKFQAALKAYDIPAPPSQITFDNQGQMQLPEEYAHAKKLKSMFEQEPGLERQLRTINALASHTVAIQHSIAFSQEYQSAKSQAAINAVLAKYDFLFQKSRPEAQMSLQFSAEGLLQVTADGVPLKF